MLFRSLAVAIHAAFPVLDPAHGQVLGAGGALRAFAGLQSHGAIALFRLVEAAAVVWAGLELLAALPLARAFSDLPGPFLGMRPWLPALLPAAGFAVLWRHSRHWIDVPEARSVAIVLLMITAVLAVLRAYAECVAGLASSPAALARNLSYLQVDLTDPDFRKHLVKHARASRVELQKIIDGAIAAGELAR